MKYYSLSNATIQGRMHAKMHLNCQDAVFASKTILKDADGGLHLGFTGVVLDGCGSGHFSEVGAITLGNRLQQEFKRLLHKHAETLFQFNPQALEEFRIYLGNFVIERAKSFVDDVLRCAGFDMPTANRGDVTNYIMHNLLATTLFIVGFDDHVFIGSAGDGIVYVEWEDGTIEQDIVDQDNMPHYLAYHWFPEMWLSNSQKNVITPPSIRWYRGPDRIILATDGAERFFVEERVDELFEQKGNTGLQRKLNAGHRFAPPNGRHRPEWETDDDAGILLLKLTEEKETTDEN